MENKVYDDERLVDDLTAQKLATAYSATLTALQNNYKKLDNTPAQNSQPSPTTNELLSAILTELRALRSEIACNRRIRLGI